MDRPDGVTLIGLGCYMVGILFFTSGIWVTILLTAGAVDCWLVFYLSSPYVKEVFCEIACGLLTKST